MGRVRQNSAEGPLVISVFDKIICLGMGGGTYKKTCLLISHRQITSSIMKAVEQVGVL